ncbi:MAG: hypothetical protein M3Y18_08010 [Candidatus Eremiobacteraeota bacterium]|nr:hypothetical protein [Candidatus Eremiobacteraeota bacterium]
MVALGAFLTPTPERGNAAILRQWGGMNDAQRLAQALNPLTKNPQFSYVKARAAARQDPAVDTGGTKQLNGDFNPDVDGCESFAMRDGSVCEWKPGQYRYVARNP